MPHSRLLPFALAFVVFGGRVGWSQEATPPSVLTEFVDAFSAAKAAAAEREFLDAERLRLEADLKRQNDETQVFASRNAVGENGELTAIFRGLGGELTSQLDAQTAQFDAGDKAQTEWLSLAARLFLRQTQTHEQAADLANRLGTQRDAFRSVRYWLIPGGLLGLFWIVAATVALPWLRRGWRRRDYAKVFGVASFAIGVTLGEIYLIDRFLGPRGVAVAATESPQVVWRRRVDELRAGQRSAETARDAARTAWEAALSMWREKAVAALGEETVVTQWLATRDRLRRLWVSTAVDAALAKQAEEHQRELAALSAPVERPGDFRMLAVAIDLVVRWSGLAAVILILYTRRGEECGKCSNRKQIERVPNENEFRCHASWNQTDATGGQAKTRVAECKFSVPSELLHKPKLFFPLVGYGTVGKSIWLAALYQSSEKNRDLIKHLVLRKLKTEGSDRLDEILRQIVSQGPDSVSATQKELPDPVMFRFRDASRVRPTELMVNVFDYAGEVMSHLPRNHPLKRRMLKAHGMLMFIDPTDPKTGWNQVNAINTFVEDANLVSCYAPVALCVTKIDELERSPHAGAVGGAVQEFSAALAQIEQKRGRGRITEQFLRQRHDATVRLLDAIWPADLANTLQKHVGQNFLYFPVTSYGFQRPPGPGPLDPWGEVEPLLWLLHMNGYETLG